MGDRVETILKVAECDTAKTVSDYVKTIHDTANILRIGAVKSAGTPLAKKIEDGTIPESLMDASGLQSVMERLGLVGGEVSEVEKDVTEDAKKETAQEKVAEVEKEVTEEGEVRKEPLRRRLLLRHQLRSPRQWKMSARNLLRSLKRDPRNLLQLEIQCKQVTHIILTCQKN